MDGEQTIGLRMPGNEGRVTGRGEEFAEAFCPEGSQIDDAVRIVCDFRKTQEFSDLTAVSRVAGPGPCGWCRRCAGGTNSPSPGDHHHPAFWEGPRAGRLRHAVATGRADLDEQLAELLRGQQPCHGEGAKGPRGGADLRTIVPWRPAARPSPGRAGIQPVADEEPEGELRPLHASGAAARSHRRTAAGSALARFHDR